MAISCVFCTTSLLACKHQLLFFGNISWDGGWESKGIINIADDFIRVGDYQWDKSDGQSEWFSGDSSEGVRVIITQIGIRNTMCGIQTIHMGPPSSLSLSFCG